jgi:pimeloyl-ACP methyl ester carboxylesterase
VITITFAGHALADDVINGQFGPGALYRIVKPSNWNGNLVLYAHGDVTGTSVVLPAEGNTVIGLLTPQGYAVAFSSFSENGWAVKDGAQRTQQLLGIFTSKFGQPSRVYIAGASLGGLITIKLAEDHPGFFAGALPTCAVAGGAQQEFDYQANTRALFDLFYPNVLPGSAGDIPPGTDPIQGVLLPAGAAMQTDLILHGFAANVFKIAAITQTPIPGATPDELVRSIATAVGAHATVFGDLMARTHGHPYFDNSKTVYTGALPQSLLDAINFGVERFTASPSALNYLDHYDDPSGDLHIPMLMLSDSRDPIAPGFNQTSYADKVAASGNSDLLVQQKVDRYNHCDFTPTELGTAFAHLVIWVETGIKP